MGSPRSNSQTFAVFNPGLYAGLLFLDPMLGVDGGRGARCRAHNPANPADPAEPPRAMAEPRAHAVVFAGVPSVLATHFPDGGGRCICLGDVFPTKTAFLECLQGLWDKPEFGPGAVWPFVLSVTKLLSSGIELCQMYVGRREGRFYFSDKNELWKHEVVFSGDAFEAVAGKGTEALVETTAALLGVDAAALPAKTPAFLYAHIGHSVELWVTAGSTFEERERLCAEYTKKMRVPHPLPSFPEFDFRPVPLGREAYKTMLPIILANNVVDQAFNDEPPTEFLGVFIGRTTTHLCRWNDEDIPDILRQQDASAGHYSAWPTPVPPTSFVSMFDLDDTEKYTSALVAATMRRA